MIANLFLQAVRRRLLDSSLFRLGADAVLRARGRSEIARLDRQSPPAANFAFFVDFCMRPRATPFGRAHDFRRIRTEADFRRLVPLRSSAELQRLPSPAVLDGGKALRHTLRAAWCTALAFVARRASAGPALVRTSGLSRRTGSRRTPLACPVLCRARRGRAAADRLAKTADNVLRGAGGSDRLPAGPGAMDHRTRTRRGIVAESDRRPVQPRIAARRLGAPTPRTARAKRCCCWKRAFCPRARSPSKTRAAAA